MDKDELRALQRPLKDQYRADPDSAVITLRADGDLGEGLTCSVETGKAIVAAGLHPTTGGDGSFACSGDMLLQALVAYAGVTMQSVATARGIVIESGRIHAEGDLDFKGTLGVDKSAPVGFRTIRLQFDLVSDAPAEQLQELIDTTERYCVVLQTLRGGVDVSAAVAAG